MICVRTMILILFLAPNSYERGHIMKAKVQLTTNHLGYMEFSICNLDRGNHDDESERCFRPLYTLSGRTRVKVFRNKNIYNVYLKIPTDLACRHCVFRWHYRAGNNWGYCPNAKYGRLGCGAQETFRTCSDISIIN